jgi:hypothetical protein
MRPSRELRIEFTTMMAVLFRLPVFESAFLNLAGPGAGFRWLPRHSIQPESFPKERLIRKYFLRLVEKAASDLFPSDGDCRMIELPHL